MSETRANDGHRRRKPIQDLRVGDRFRLLGREFQYVRRVAQGYWCEGVPPNPHTIELPAGWLVSPIRTQSAADAAKEPK